MDNPCSDLVSAVLLVVKMDPIVYFDYRYAPKLRLNSVGCRCIAYVFTDSFGPVVFILKCTFVHLHFYTIYPPEK
jgi:hypothetical protein